MSQETYTFACPVCAVRLSVPKALAGVRGPCPQCLHEITAPDPGAVLAPVLAGAGGVGAPPPSPAAVAPPPKPAGPAIPGLDRSMVPPAPARGVASSVVSAPLPGLLPSGSALRDPQVSPSVPPSSSPEPESWSAGPAPRPCTTAVELAPAETMAAALPLQADRVAPSPWEAPPVEPSAEGEEADISEDEEDFNTAPRARRSPLGLAVAVLLLIALLAAAALKLLPRPSLQRWLGLLLPVQAVEAVLGPESAGPRSGEAGAVSSAQDSPPTDTAKPPRPPDIRFRQGSPSATPPDARAPDHPASAPPGSPEPSAPTPAPAVASPPPPPVREEPREGRAVPSLLPELSQGSSAAPAATNEAVAGAQEALTLFLQARNWQDRMALCEAGESLRGEMESYYGKVQDGPNTPTSVEHIASAPLPDGTRTVQIFHVTFTDLPQGFPVPVRQTEEGWKIDWRAFVEFREGRLKKFLAAYQDPPEVFRVQLQCSQQTDLELPNADQKYTFRIAAPIDGHEGFVYADKDDPIAGPKIAKMLDANAIHRVMAKLKWVRGPDGRAHVELCDIVLRVVAPGALIRPARRRTKKEPNFPLAGATIDGIASVRLSPPVGTVLRVPV